jgi:hypothetical protein
MLTNRSGPHSLGLASKPQGLIVELPHETTMFITKVRTVESEVGPRNFFSVKVADDFF